MSFGTLNEVAVQEAMTEVQKVPPDLVKRLPTWVFLWAQGNDVDINVFDDERIIDNIENGNAMAVIDLCLVNAQKIGHEKSMFAFSDITEKFMLVTVISDYCSAKPAHSFRRYGRSDSDQIRRGDPNYHYRKK